MSSSISCLSFSLSFPSKNPTFSTFHVSPSSSSPSPSPSSSRYAKTLACTSSPNTRRKPAMDNPKPTSKTRRRSSYGTSRRSSLKKTFIQEQVTFTGPISDDPRVGIIGGGMAGLLCALSLEERGVKSTVFDTGKHGLGGRMSTRIIDPQPLVFDHAAQFFTVSDPMFAGLVDGWLEKGLIRKWEGTIGELELGGQFVPFTSDTPRYVGVNGMRALADSILAQTSLVDVVRPSWISTLEPFNGMWHLSENGKPRGKFDAVVIAHNGKCANRLLSSSGLPLIAKQMKKLNLSSMWALLAAFKNPLPIPSGAPSFEGAFVSEVDSLSWMGNNSSKLACRGNSRSQCWTFFSTSAYGMKNKVPQEHVSRAAADKVTTGMLQGVEDALGLERGTLEKPFYTRVQLWGAALPTNTLRIPFIFDPHGRAGICGDWLLGANVESAALSGMALANHIADYLQSGVSCPEEFSVGLDKEFEPLECHDIGQFPGFQSTGKAKLTPEYQLS